VLVRDRLPVPIVGGAGEYGYESFRPLISWHALDIYQVDLARKWFIVATSLRWLSTCRDAFLFENYAEDSLPTSALTLKLSWRTLAGFTFPKLQDSA